MAQIMQICVALPRNTKQMNLLQLRWNVLVPFVLSSFLGSSGVSLPKHTSTQTKQRHKSSDSETGDKIREEVTVVLPLMKFPVIKIIQSFLCSAEVVKYQRASWGQQQSSVVERKSDVAADCFVVSCK